MRNDFVLARRRDLGLADDISGYSSENSPLQSATKSATNGEFPEAPRNANAHQRLTYADGQRARAERTGFEPAEGCDPFTDLANRRFRPLSHLSELRFSCFVFTPLFRPGFRFYNQSRAA